MKMCIPFAVSHAWQIGRTVIRATRMKQDPVDALLREEKPGSLVIISGRVYVINNYPGVFVDGCSTSV